MPRSSDLLLHTILARTRHDTAVRRRGRAADRHRGSLQPPVLLIVLQELQRIAPQGNPDRRRKVAAKGTRWTTVATGRVNWPPLLCGGHFVAGTQSGRRISLPDYAPRRYL
jgi:hypothetical protein